MGNTKDFFSEKKLWSHYKDQLLRKYLPAYFQKILCTGVDILYIDGFAGKGRFEDGQEGSPLIVNKIISESLSRTRSKTSILPCFIEYKYADELVENLEDSRCKIISGDYKIEVPKLLNNHKGKNVFLYVDPYGIKHMHYSIFDLLRSNQYQTKELLFNFNSFGFIREGCKLLKVSTGDMDAEVENVDGDKFINDITNMNKIAGGIYWQDIIKRIQTGEIDGKQAEKLFVEAYKNQLSKIFKHVINIPIRTGDDSIPKYQMIHGTDYIDGILLMANTMLECDNDMRMQFKHGQLSLIDYAFATNDIKKDILDVMPTEYLPIKEFCLKLYNEIGVVYLHKDINEGLKQLEKEGKVEILRVPSLTPHGRKATAVSIMDRNYSIMVKKK